MQKVKLNIVPKGVKRATYLSQNDNGRVVRYELFNELVPYTLDGSETITVKVVRPDGEEIVSSVPNTEAAYIDVIFNDDMSAIAGVGAGEIKITDGETVLGSHNFDINVEIGAYNSKGVVIETETGTLLSFNTEVEDNALEYESEIPYNAEGYTGLEVINSRTTPVLDKAPYLYRKTPSGNNCLNKLVGLSAAFNQLVQNGNFESTTGWSAVGGTLSVNNNIGTYTVSTVGSATYSNVIQTDISNIAYRKSFVRFSIKPSHTKSMRIYCLRVGEGSNFYKDISVVGGLWNLIEVIINPTTVNTYQAIQLALNCTSANGYSVGDTDDIKDFNVIDLTALFGSSTIADYLYNLETQTAGAGVQKFKELGFDAPYYPYNAGSLMSSIPVARKTVGINFYNGTSKNSFCGSTGLISYNADNSYLGVDSLISVKPNTTYSIAFFGYTVGALYVGFFDSNSDFIIRRNYNTEVDTVNNCVYGVFTTDNNARYVLPYAYNINYPYTDLSKAKIMIVEGDYFPDPYEPYKETIYNLGGDTLRGLLKLDENNNIYADGDIKTSDGKIKRKFGIVDLGSLYWAVNDGVFRAIIDGIKNPITYDDRKTGFMFSSKYMPDTQVSISGGSMTDKAALRYDGRIFIKDTAYNDATAFTNSLDGVYLVYELATPTTESSTPFDNPQEAGSTEEIIDGNVYGSVDLGSLSWEKYDNSFFAAHLDSKNNGFGLCDIYNCVYDLNFANAPDKSFQLRGVGLLIKNTDYSDADAFKTAMDGVYLYYEKSDSAGVEIPLGHDSVYGTDLESVNIDFDTTIYGGNINANDGVLSSEYNSDGSVKPTPEIIDITPALIPVRAGDNYIVNSADGDQTIKYYNQVE